MTTEESGDRMLVQIHRFAKGDDESTLCGALWIEDGKLTVEGIEESTELVERLIPTQVRDLDTDKLIGPGAGEAFLFGLTQAELASGVSASIEYPHPDAFRR